LSRGRGEEADFFDMSAYTVGSRPPAEGAVQTEEGEKALFAADQSGLNAVEREKAVHLAVQCGLKAEVAVYLAVRGDLEAEEVKKLLDNAVQCGLEAEEAERKNERLLGRPTWATRGEP
jgi:hypothetical protein